MENYDVMAVGDYGSGRTCFVIVFSHERFPDTYIPSVADWFAKEMHLSEHRVVLMRAKEDHCQENNGVLSCNDWCDHNIGKLKWLIVRIMVLKTMENYDVMAVGDYDSGRTCFVIVFSHERFPDTYIPSVAEWFAKEIHMSEHRVVLMCAREDHCHAMENLAVMAVGDWFTGRTNFHGVFLYGQFFGHYRPSVCDAGVKVIKVNEQREVKMAAREDHGSGEDYDRLRPLNYPCIDVFLAFFSVASRESFESVEERWIPELRHHRPDAPIIIVAHKIDLRDDESVETISSEEGLEMAKKMGTSYHEASALQMRGVEECYQLAVEIADLNKNRSKKSRVILPPIRPMPEQVPAVKPAVSSFVNDWGQMITDPKFSDVKFIVQGGRSVLAHKLVLCSASPVFEKILLFKSYGKDDIVSGQVQGFHSISEGDDGEETTVELSKDVKAETFDKILEFLYTGSLSEKKKDVDISDLKRTAQMFEMNQLDVECDDMETNSKKGDDFKLEDVLKPMTMREYLKKDAFSDVIFNVNGTRIPAHNVVIYARSPKIAEELDSSSVEGEKIKEIEITDTSVENFTLLLDYLYTDFPDVDASSDLIGLIKLANKYGAHRLVTLCEVKLKTVHPINETNAIELLHKFKEYETTQMVALCFHYISHNYTLISGREEFSTLDSDDTKYVTAHRWPSPDYEKEREDFYQKFHDGSLTSKSKRRCIIA